jgi:hypothetical protein
MPRNNLLIWTIVTHFLILFGAGHGGLTIGVTEILFFPYFNIFQNTAEAEYWHLHMVGFSGAVGTLLLTAAIFTNSPWARKSVYIGGLAACYASIILLSLSPNVQFTIVTATPFIILTLVGIFKMIRKGKSEIE